MKSKVIFEIPIYSIKEDKFYQKWKDYKEKCKKRFLEHNDELGDYELWFDRSNFPKYVWKYNQIIGYIQISIKEKDIIFDLWLSKDKRYTYNTTKKHFIEYIPTNGLHFFVNNMKDKEIKVEINKFLKIIESDFIKENMYLDRTIYDNLINIINIKNMIK